MAISEPASIRLHIPLTWDDIQRDAALLSEKLAAAGRWRGVVAVTRGGLVPAALVSRTLGIRTIETVSIAVYEGERLGAPQLLKPPAAAGDGEGWLIIDDLVDTGVTIQIVRTMSPKAHVGVLYAKPAGRDLADTIVREYPQDAWIDFPWEMAERR